jgi:hypothetical protein
MLSKESFKKAFSGQHIKDVAVKKSNCFYFLLRNSEQSAKASAVSESDVDKRWVCLLLDQESDKNVSGKKYEGYDSFVISASEYPESKAICISDDGNVFLLDGSQYDKEDIPRSEIGPLRGTVLRARMIQGMLYVAGSLYSVCRRRGPKDWESLCLNLPLGTSAERKDLKKRIDMAFQDIDGFSRDDLYAVAGRGVVWHFNGKAWRRIPFPSNMLLESICCAGDNHVYVGAQSGALFRGRGDKWEMIHSGGMSLPFKDIVWHADQLWCTSDYGLWTVKDNKVRAVDELPAEIKVCSGNLSVADGVMLMGGAHGAAFHDGKKWQLIFNQHQMEQSLEKK